MKTVKATFGGKVYELPANQSGWISVSESPLPEGITAEMLKNRPRVGSGCKNEPIIKDDAGKEIHLGSAVFRREDEKIQQNGSGGSVTIKGLNEACNNLAVALENMRIEMKLKELPKGVADTFAVLVSKCKDANQLELHEGDDVMTILDENPKMTFQKLKEEAAKAGLKWEGTKLVKA